MWHKYYRIAERQFTTGKFKTVEMHARKALQFARESANQVQIAQTLALLGKFYMDTDNHCAAEVLSESIQAAEQAYGPATLEVAEQLELLACVLDFEAGFEAAEPMRLRALNIVQSYKDRERSLDSLDLLVDFYLSHEKFDMAQTYFLQSLEIRKELYGAVSEEVEEEIEQYSTILEGLGRGEEAQDLEAIMHHCSSCGPEDRHHKYSPEVDSILAQVSASENRGDLDGSIDAFREAIVKLAAIAERQAELVSQTEPFRELKLRALGNPQRWAKSSFAQLLRLKAEQEGSHDLLLEAHTLLSQLVSETGTLSDVLHYMLTLLDLAKNDPDFYPELEQAIATAPECATSMYTKALMMFRRMGSTSESRAAMRAAINANPSVPLIFGTGCEPSDVPNHFSFGDESEAQGYYLEAFRQWDSTPGAADFMIDVIGRALPRRVRNGIDCIAPPSRV